MPVSWTKNTKLIPIAARYATGSILLSDAAKEAGLTSCEFMEYLAVSGYQSKYSWEDFERGQNLLDKFLDYKPPAR
jgi:hypothetical protein